MAADPSADEIDAWLDSIEPDPADVRHAKHLRRIFAVRKAFDDAQDELSAAVLAAREAGDSWSVIGVGIDTSSEKARQQYGGQSS